MRTLNNVRKETQQTMKIKVQGSRILECLRNVSGVSNAKISPAILGNVFLEAKDGKLTTMASNLEITLVSSVECEVTEPGATTVPAKMFQSILSALPVGEVEITVDNKEKMKVTSGESSFRLSGIPAKEFPTLAKVKDDLLFTMNAKDLKTALRKTAYAQSCDETRRSLKGMLFDFAGEQLKTVATDGRRLSVSLVKADWKCHDTKFTMPKDAVREIMRLLTDEGSVVIKYFGNMAMLDIESAKTMVFCKTMAERYPNYAAVIPSEITATALVDRERMCDMMNRAKVMALETTPSVKIAFSDGSIDSRVIGNDDGESRDKFAIKYTGEKLEFAFNPYYIHEALSVIDSDSVKIEFSGSTRPIVVKGDGEDGLAVIMPLRQA